MAPGPALFEQMEQGDYDATLVELHRLDAYRAKRQDSKLSSSGHYHSIGWALEMLAKAMYQAKSADPVKVAKALEK